MAGVRQDQRPEGGDADAPAPRWRLWPPAVSWQPGDGAARARTALSGLTPAALWRDHRLFTVTVCVSVLPRIVAALGFAPAELIQDSFSYMEEGVHLSPGQLRPAGYPMLLRVLEPFHSLLLVTTVQHLMGIALAAIIYGVLRTRGLPAWGATLAAAPTLFDSRQIWLESAILPDTLFTVVLMVVVAILLVRPRPAVWQAAVVGVLVAWASVIRGNGAPVFVIILAFLLLMRAGWRAVTACVTAFAVPLLAYMGVFYADYHQFDITNSTGMFLWARTMSFANCAVIKPPADLRPLCREAQPGHPTSPATAWSVPALLDERSPADYLWNLGAWYQHDAHPGINAYNNRLALQFAERAIAAQPGAYLTTVGEGVMLSFLATDRSLSLLSLHFTVAPHVARPAPYMRLDETWYAHTTANTHVVQPWAYLMFWYQEPVWFPGIVFFGVMAAGLVLLIRRWRGWGGYAALPWAVALANLVVPIALVEADYRYAISAVPFACLALGLVLVRRPAPRGFAVVSAAPDGGAAAGAGDPASGAAALDGA